MGFNTTMASYLTLALSHMLASRAIIEDKDKQKRLEAEFHRLMKGKRIQDVFVKATLKYSHSRSDFKISLTVLQPRTLYIEHQVRKSHSWMHT